MISEEFLSLFVNYHLGINIYLLLIISSFWFNINIDEDYNQKSYSSFNPFKDLTTKLMITIPMILLLIADLSHPENSFTQLLYLILSLGNWAILYFLISWIKDQFKE